ncbi:hypothetical protein PR003_g9144 [Phytophthora rubi]|uniref:Uncharacterized protein n=1 Tax=Phytophthora rubi TaxID=129364 RepID=A0A6A3N042_9STRA|nr:hypothetical protein PR002_g8885 [Phytophthora rubi]KAE9037036.1 hypothetical protein PR001_g8563 [Phytophthora rubi]KAE9343112.1 hypothetical protein PR003_g9144 [Phytophthora rubi]
MMNPAACACTVARQASTRSFLPALPTATVALSSSCSDDPMLSKQTSSRCGLCAGATVDSAPHAPVHEVDRNRVNLRTLASRGTGRDQPATHAKVHALVSRLSHTFRLRTSAKSTTMCVSTPSSRHAAWRELKIATPGSALGAVRRQRDAAGRAESIPQLLLS